MVKKTKIYKATDGTLFISQDEASEYQGNLNSSPTNPAIREAFFDSAKRLPKYGKYVDKSKNEFLRAVSYSNPVELCRDLLFNYTSAVVSIFGAQEPRSNI
jgi:hypothetical protein